MFWKYGWQGNCVFQILFIAHEGEDGLVIINGQITARSALKHAWLAEETIVSNCEMVKEESAYLI